MLAKLRKRDLSFAPEADRRTLIRRASYDLTGLPPSQEQLDAFLSIPAPMPSSLADPAWIDHACRIINDCSRVSIGYST